jgi:hypothetical protein
MLLVTSHVRTLDAISQNGNESKYVKQNATENQLKYYQILSNFKYHHSPFRASVPVRILPEPLMTSRTGRSPRRRGGLCCRGRLLRPEGVSEKNMFMPSPRKELECFGTFY